MKKIIKIMSLSLMISISLTVNAKSISEFEEEIKNLSFEEQEKIFYKYMNSSGNKNETYPFLGYMYYNGFGVTKNTKAAIHIFQRTADEGSKIGHYLLGRHYIENGNDVTKGLNYLIQASDSNLIEATLYIGKIYKEGIGVIQDDYYSSEYYYKAAKIGSTEAKYIIAQDLLKSIEVSKRNKGLAFLTESAEGRYAPACRQLKDLYISKNNIITQDVKKHFTYLLCLADTGDLESIQKVAEYYAKGFIVMINNKLSYNYYNKYVKIVKEPKTEDEIETYYKAAISNIKMKKYNEAVNLLKITSSQGHSESSNVLGRLYESNYLGNPNLKNSLKYYKLANQQGFESEIEVLRLIEKIKKDGK